MSKRLILQLLLLFSIIYSYSQPTQLYRGKISNSLGEPVIGAQFKEVETGNYIAISDSIGNYYFESDAQKIVVYQMGYEEVEVLPGDQQIVLKEAIDMLETFILSENKTGSKIKNSTVSLDVIKPELITNTSPTNIEESVGRMSGVQVVDNQPSIRSGGGWSYGAGSRVQVMVDGMPMLSGDAGQPLWTFLPTEGIANVEILKGASSVIYGSSALNGVINIETKGAYGKPFTRVTASAGVYDLPKRESLRYRGDTRNRVSNVTAYHTSRHKNFGLKLGLNALQDEGYKMGDYDNRVRGTLGLDWRLGRSTSIGVNTSVQQGESGSFLLWESLDLGYTALDSNVTDNQVTRASVDPYLKFYTGKIKHTLQARYLHIDNQVDNGDPMNDQSNMSDLWYYEYQAKYSSSSGNTQIIGGLVRMNTVTLSPLFNGEQTAQNKASYIQFTQKIKKLQLTAGARNENFELNDRSDSKPVFRAGINYQAGKYSYLRASYGQGYRFPSIAESYVSTSVGPVTIFPNDNLASETGTNLEIGFKQGLRVGKTEVLVDLALFRMEYENMMEFTFGQWGPLVPPTFGAGFRTLNTGKARVDGIELNISFEKKIGKSKLQGFVGYTLALTENLEPQKVIYDGITRKLTYENTSTNTTDNRLKYRPRDVVKGDVIWKFKRLTLGAGFAYQSQMENIDTAFVALPLNNFIPGVQESIEQQLTKYVLLNARIGFKLSSKFSTNFIFSNLANREYAVRPADLGAPRSARFEIAYTLDG